MRLLHLKLSKITYLLKQLILQAQVCWPCHIDIYMFLLRTLSSTGKLNKHKLNELRLEEQDIFVWICHVACLPMDICKLCPSILHHSQRSYLTICILEAMQRLTQVVRAFRRLKKRHRTGSLSTWGDVQTAKVKLMAGAKLRKLTQCPGMHHWVILWRRVETPSQNGQELQLLLK